MSTVSQDNSFGRDFLEEITHWIGNNMSPDDVFSVKDLENWARDVFPNPEDMFSDEELYNWAEAHGMIQK